MMDTFYQYSGAMLKKLDSIVGDASVVSFGEPSHGELDHHEFCCEMFKYLVLHRGFRVLVLESAWGVQDLAKIASLLKLTRSMSQTAGSFSSTRLLVNTKTGKVGQSL